MGSFQGSESALTAVVGATDSVNRSEATAAFERVGWKAEAFAGPDELREACERLRPALVLLAFHDMASKEYSLCRELSARFPVVVVTWHSDEGALDQAYAAGAIDVVGAPVRWRLLVSRLARLQASAETLKELERSHLALKTTQRIARIGSWVLDLAAGHMEWSEQMFELLGLPPGSETSFESFCLCIHPQDRDAAVGALRRAAARAEDLSAQHRVVLSNGSVRHVQLRGEMAGDEASMHGTLQDVTEQRRAQAKIRRLAHFDSLTGLTNRRRFMQQLERFRDRCVVTGDKMALLYMDLDQFKRINDTLGHSAGDALLRSVADQLFEEVRVTDLVSSPSDLSDESEISRLGGDEFAVLITRIGSREDARLVAERILAALPTPIVVDGHEISTTGSIGIALYPDDGDDAETLVKHADRALYHAKEMGRNNFQFFSEELNAGALKRLTLESRLRLALETGGLHLNYQPRIDIGSGRIDGVEALLRWNDPELGSVTPKEFIPVAEETGLIVPLGAWVIREACRQGAEWHKAGLPPLRVSVNVSTEQFRREDLVATVAGALEETGFDPNLLELEITESLMLQDDEATATLLRELRAMGMRIALDDFGTGYSSLSYLARYPLDVLKLDRSLVRDLTVDPHARGVATAVISMAHALELRVVAEGVDQADQLSFLREQGCDEFQGFLFAGALEAAEIAERVRPEEEEDVPLLAFREGDTR
jgi:diguanylate cyclase (GGDEF)-like protein